MTTDLQLFDYIYQDNNAAKTLILLHGTGGTKEDFLFLNEVLEKTYNLVGISGNIHEHGMSRFFKRDANGVFDQESIREETQKLHRFVTSWIQTYNLETGQLFFLGYSNGANMLLSLLFSYPTIITHLVLLHSMLPFEVTRGSLDLSKHAFFLSIGEYDQIIPPSKQYELIEVLQSFKAVLTVKEYQHGHEITHNELTDVVSFLKEF